MISKARISNAIRVRAKAREDGIEGFVVGGLLELKKNIDNDTKKFLTTLKNKQLILLQP